MCQKGLGKQSEAIASFKEALKIDACYVDALINLANELSEKKEFNEAVVNYKLAADEDKKDI